jgi:pyruvate,water dikinase
VATWVESPEIVLDTLRVMAQGELNDPHANVRALKIRAQETLFELQKRVPDEFRYFFTEVVRLAQAYTSLDDLEHYQTTRLTLPMRRAVRELGVRLVDLGIVNDPMDVFFANSAVLEEAICAPHWERWVSLSRNIEANRNEYFAARSRTPRWTLAEQEEEQVDVLNGLKGIAGSPGKAIGPVFVIHGPEDFGKFPKGAVLVARTTNPAWTPLFYGACAVITESGGPLSHGAVTAREMQKPAVMAVRGILTAFENGQMVEVDGSRGIVTPVAEAA